MTEAKPDPKPRPDLRLVSPFPALRRYVDSVDISALDDFEYGHTPYVVFLIKAADEWRSTHEGQLPQTFVQNPNLKLC